MSKSKTQTQSREKTAIKYPNRYNVVIFNDDFTPMEFVIQLLIEVFNKNIEEAKDITLAIHNDGKAVAGTYSYEIAEQKVAECIVICRYNGYQLKVDLEKV